MRTAINYIALGVMAVTACASGSGQTKRDLAGSIKVVFTNASPQPMCELQMTLEQSSEFGDNWLPEGGLPSGRSVEFKVKPGKYKATWSTCKTSGQPQFAATLIGESSIALDAQTQMFAYVPDTVPPTQRAPTLGREFKLVRFVGQAIEAVAEPAKPAKIDAFSAAEAELATGAAHTNGAAKSDSKPAPAPKPR